MVRQEIFKSNNILERKVLLELVNTNTLGKKIVQSKFKQNNYKIWDILYSVQYKVHQYTKQYSTYCTSNNELLTHSVNKRHHDETRELTRVGAANALTSTNECSFSARTRDGAACKIQRARSTGPGAKSSNRAKAGTPLEASKRRASYSYGQ